MQEDQNDSFHDRSSRGSIRRALKAFGHRQPSSNDPRISPRGHQSSAEGPYPAEERRQQLSAAEKEALWRRIQASVPRARQRVLWWPVSAAVLLLAGLAGWLLVNRKPAAPLKQMMAAARVADTVKAVEIQVVTASPEKAGETPGQPLYRTVVVPYGKRTMLVLPDNSRVWLNAGSTLVYPEEFTGGERQVYLEGEAYFDVRHNERHPFFVQTRNMEIKVLGTEFNVSAYTDDELSNVVLVKGSVELSANRDKFSGKVKTRLTPHEIAVYKPSEKQLEVSNTKVEEYVSWRTGSMVFNATPLRDILKKLQRYYRVSISLESPDLGGETFTGPLDLKKKIEEVMDIICITTALVYEKQDGKIILKEHK